MLNVGLPLSDRTNQPYDGAGFTAGGPGTTPSFTPGAPTPTPEGLTLTPGATTPTPSDTVENEAPKPDSEPANVSAAFGPPKPKPNKRKKKEA